MQLSLCRFLTPLSFFLLLSFSLSDCSLFIFTCHSFSLSLLILHLSSPVSKFIGRFYFSFLSVLNSLFYLYSILFFNCLQFSCLSVFNSLFYLSSILLFICLQFSFLYLSSFLFVSPYFPISLPSFVSALYVLFVILILSRRLYKVVIRKEQICLPQDFGGSE